MHPAQRLLQSRATTIGFIGLGRMGFQMATNLVAKRLALNNSFLVCDALPSAAVSFVAHLKSQFPTAHLDVSHSPAHLAAHSSTIISMLPSTKEVQSVYLAQDGILSALNSLPLNAIQDTVLIDSTTLAVDAARNIAQQLYSVGAQMVDAPVSGGVTGAKAATLSFLVGGPQDTFQAVSPLLALMGQRIIHCGPSGAGLAAKICNNLILGIEQIAVAEAMLLGQKLGLDPAILASVINSSTGSCWSSSVNNPVKGSLPDKSPPCERDFEGGFATSLMYKDMGLATDIADKSDSPIPLGKMARKLYQTAIVQHPELAQKDFSSIYSFLQQRVASSD